MRLQHRVADIPTRVTAFLHPNPVIRVEPHVESNRVAQHGRNPNVARRRERDHNHHAPREPGDVLDPREEDKQGVQAGERGCVFVRHGQEDGLLPVAPGGLVDPIHALPGRHHRRALLAPRVERVRVHVERNARPPLQQSVEKRRAGGGEKARVRLVCRERLQKLVARLARQHRSPRTGEQRVLVNVCGRQQSRRQDHPVQPNREKENGSQW